MLESIISDFGFEIVSWKTMESSYCHNPSSMAELVFECVFFVCKVPEI